MGLMEDDSAKRQQLTAVKGDVAFEEIFFWLQTGRTLANDFLGQKPGRNCINRIADWCCNKTTIVNLTYIEVIKGVSRRRSINIKNRNALVHDALFNGLFETLAL